jgi:ribosomal protein S18 acetylase RimI-like enzyme
MYEPTELTRAPAHVEGQAKMRRAAKEDADVVVAIVQDAASWLKQRGSTQWRLYLGEKGARHIRNRVAGADGSEVYLAMRNSVPVGTFSLQWDDPNCWDDRGVDGRAGYLHMLAVHRVARGTALGRIMLDFATRTIASRGRELIRLDCWAGNPALCDYYLKLGFTHVGYKGGRIGLAQFEKRAGE